MNTKNACDKIKAIAMNGKITNNYVTISNKCND